MYDTQQLDILMNKIKKLQSTNKELDILLSRLSSLCEDDKSIKNVESIKVNLKRIINNTSRNVNIRRNNIKRNRGI